MQFAETIACWDERTGRLPIRDLTEETISVAEHQLLLQHAMGTALMFLLFASFGSVRSQSEEPTHTPHNWVVIRGSCTATCGINGRRPYLVACVHPELGTVNEVDCVGDKPTPEEDSCNRKPCGGMWKTENFTSCSNVCRGIRTRSVYCEERPILDPDAPVSRFGELVRVEDERCEPAPKPNATEPCGLECTAPRIDTPPSILQPTTLPYTDAFYAVGQPVFVHRGKRLSIDAVVVAGFPSPNVAWTLPDGTELAAGEATDTARVFDNGTLSISNVGDSDAGMYTATAKNVYGADVKTSKVEVVCRPNILVSLESRADQIPPDGNRYYDAGALMIIQQGGDLYIDVVVNQSCSDVKYTWTLANGSRLGEGDALGSHRVLRNGTLVVENVRLSLSDDSYKVEISNMGGSDTAVSILTVVCRPNILIPPSAPFDLPDSNRSFVVGQDWAVRQGFALRADVLTDPKCPILSSNWSLPSGDHLETGESFDKYTVLSNGSLLIVGADLNDRGTHSVEVRGSGGSDTAASTLDVICRPRIRPSVGTLPGLPDSDRYFEVGQRWTVRTGYDVYVDVVIDPSCPKASITWQLANGESVAQGRSVNGARVLPNGTLVLENAQLSDVGTYAATATTRGGNDTVRSQLDVICRPNIIPGVGSLPGLPDANRYFTVGQSWVVRKGFALQADVVVNSSCPDVQFSWILPNGDRLLPGDRRGRISVSSNGSLTITGADLADAGQYRAEVRTPGGTDAVVSPLRVVCRPKIIPATGTPPGLPFSDRYFGAGQGWTIRTGYSVYADVEIDPSCPDVDITWRLSSGTHLGEADSEGDFQVLSNGTLIIRSALLSDAGRYRVTARNDGGTDHANSQLTVICSPDILPVLSPVSGLPFSDRTLSAGQRWIIRSGFSLRADVIINPVCPDVDLSWTLPNGVTVSAGDTSGKFSVSSNGTLYIGATALADEGSYTVVATTRGGTDDVTSPLSVICSPRILPGVGTLPGLPDSNRYFLLGQQWEIRDGWILQADVVIDPSCPDVNITWQLADGSRLRTGQRLGKYSILSNGTLVIEETSLSDIGMYSADARTAGGTDSASSSLSVICRPQIIPGSGFLSGLPNSDRFFVVGESSWNIRTGFTAYADVIINQTCPEADIVWQLANGNELRSGETDGKFQVLPNGTLVVNNVQLADGGNYRATVTNRGGSDSAASLLSVACHPRISPASTPSPDIPKSNRYMLAGQNWIVRRGRHLFADVVVDARCPEGTISWQLPNGNRLNAGDTSGNYRVRNNGTLIIRNAQVADEGIYTATIQSRGGTDSVESRLSVRIPPRLDDPPRRTMPRPIPNVPSLNRSVGQEVFSRPGQDLIIRAKVTEARPIADVVWTLPDGTSLSSNSKLGRFEVTSDGTLIIRNVTEGDRGSYSATARNDVGTDDGQTRVVVIPEPRFIGTPVEGSDPSGPVQAVRDTVILEAGETLRLTAELEDPNLNLTVVNWTLPNGGVLRQGERFGKFSAVSRQTLVITNIQPEDAGKYVAVATNLAGTAIKTIFVTVADYVYTLEPGECTATCGTTGIQVSRAVCIRKESGARTDNETKCIVAGRSPPAIPPPVPCNRRHCIVDFQWDTDDWVPNPCSPPCSSHQTRVVTCLQSQLGTDPIPVADIECVGYPKPLHRRICSEDQCQIRPKFRRAPPIVMPLNKSPVYNRYDLHQSIAGVQGRYLYVDAVLAQGSPPAVVQWTFSDMSYLDAGQTRGRFTVFDNGTLRITNAQFADRGIYMTTARNVAGWDLVQSPFNIYVPPNITSHKVYRSYRPNDVSPTSSSHVARPGETVAIQCRHWGSPQPTLTWTLNGIPVKFDDRVKVDTTNCLIITDFTSTDEGTYKCVATNVVGVDSKNVTVTAKSMEVKWVRVTPPCPVSCGRGSVVVSSECRSIAANTVVDDLECGEMPRPLNYRERCNTPSCPALPVRWDVGAYGACAESCRQTREVSCKQKTGDRRIRPVSQHLCRVRRKKPEEERHCSAGGVWDTSAWSECSNSCGRRIVKCVDPCRENGKGDCQSAGPKPPHRKACDEKCRE